MSPPNEPLHSRDRTHPASREGASRGTLSKTGAHFKRQSHSHHTNKNTSTKITASTANAPQSGGPMIDR